MSPDGDVRGLAKGHPNQPDKTQWPLRSWALLGIIALALAGLFAVLLVMSRTPFLEDVVEWPDQFFQKGLVTHVVFAFVVWFLAVFASLSCQSERETKPAKGPAIWRQGLPLALAAAGSCLLIIAPFSGGGDPSLNNYIPVIINPIFYLGLVLVALGVLIPAIGLIITAAQSGATISADRFLMVTGAMLYIAALMGFAVAFLQLGQQTIDFDYNEQLIWGGGHLLQFLNLTLLLVAWDRLSRETAAGPLITPRMARLASGLLVLSAAAGLSFFGLFGVRSESFTSAFTYLQFALATPLLVVLFDAAPILWRNRRLFRFHDPAFLCLASSLIVFMVGAALGLFVDGNDTRTPAHYHGVIGGINLAFVGLYYVYFLPALGRAPRITRGLRLQIWLYAAGQLLFVVGMFAAGGMGSPRKTAESGIDFDTVSTIAATIIRDVGGALSIIGGLAFIYIAGRALLSKPTGPDASSLASVGREEDFSS